MDLIELRIGNYVGFKNRDDIDYCVLQEISTGGVHILRYFKNGEVDDQPELKEDITPIKLNEEILFRLGFGEFPLLRGLADHGIYGRFSSFERIIYQSEYNRKSISVTLCNDKGQGEYYVFFKDDDNVVTLTRNLMYVHQLQNLYFSLKGEELKYDT